MIQAIRLGWRNLWRNKRRTAITLAAVAFATSILVVTDALLKGMVNNMIRNATDLMVGEAQAHAPGYLADPSLYTKLDGVPQMIERVRARGIAASPRRYGYGLVAHDKKSAGAMFWGVEPKLEREVSDLAQHLQSGGFVHNRVKRGVVLGRKTGAFPTSRCGCGDYCRRPSSRRFPWQ